MKEEDISRFREGKTIDPIPEVQAKIEAKERVFWQNELRVSQMQIDSIRQEQENGDKMIEILENTMEFCGKKLLGAQG